MRNDRKHIPVETNCASLIFGLGEYFSDSFEHSQAFISDDKSDTVKATVFQPLEEFRPTGFILFHALSGAENFSVTLPVYSNRHESADILVFAAPIAAKVDTINIHIWIFPALKRTVTPVLDMYVCFLVQLTDC